jgi:hypothetical protein
MIDSIRIKASMLSMCEALDIVLDQKGDIVVMGIWDRASKFLEGKPFAEDLENQYLIDMANEYHWTREILNHWLARNVFLTDDLGLGSLPVYHTDDFGVGLNYNIQPTISPYKLRTWTFLKPIASFHDRFEQVAIQSLLLVGTKDGRQYQSIQDAAEYLLKREEGQLSIATLISPISGLLRDMVDSYASANNGIKVFHSNECSVDGEYLIALPYPEFYGRLPHRYNEFGIVISAPQNVCVVR